MPGDLTPLLHHLPAWLLVLFRLSGIFLLAPMFSSRTVPMRLKALLVLALSICVYPMLLTAGRSSAGFINAVVEHPMPLWSLIPNVGLELLVGYVIGFAASIPLIGMQMGGYVIDQQIGLSFAGIVNPDLQAQTGVVGQTLYILALTIFIILGGHRVMLEVLIGSFQQVPLGGFTDFHALLGLVVGLMHIMFDLALRIAAPLLCLIFLETLAMGFIARTVPQLNILSIGFTVRILVGMVFLIAFVGVGAGVYVQTTRHVLQELARAFGP